MVHGNAGLHKPAYGILFASLSAKTFSPAWTDQG